jgi:hypothetical protein
VQFSLDAWSALGQLDCGADAREEGVLLSRDGAKERLKRTVQCRRGCWTCSMAMAMDTEMVLASSCLSLFGCYSDIQA